MPRSCFEPYLSARRDRLILLAPDDMHQHTDSYRVHPMRSTSVRLGALPVTEPTSLSSFRERVRRWLAEQAEPNGWTSHTAPQAPESDGDALKRARACQRSLHDAGLTGITWPADYGGQGLGVREQVVFDEEVADADLPLRPFAVGLGMCGPTLLTAGTEEQRRRYLHPLLRGDELWCQLFSEPGAGSDVAALETRARPVEDGWLVTGQKVWTSGAHQADFGLLLARTDPDVPKHRGLTMFVLDMHAAGVTVRPLQDMTGATEFSEVFLDDVHVPHHHLLGDVGDGWRTALTTLMNERVSIGTRPSTAIPTAGELLEQARSHDIADSHSLHDALIDAYVRDRIVTLMGTRIREAIKQGQQPGPEGSVAKLASTELVTRCARLQAEMSGPAATAWEHDDPTGANPSAPLLLAPAFSIAGGTDEVLRNIIGERVLGLPKEPQVDRDVPFSQLRHVD